MSAPEQPVLVVGAGPTGLAAALELARLGLPVRIIDKSAHRSAHSKAVGVNPRTLELLENSSVTERLLAAGHPIARAKLFRGDDPIVTVDLSRLPHRYNFMLALSQAETERILEQRLAEFGVEVEWGTAFAQLEQRTDSVHYVLSRGGTTIDGAAPYLIGADGAHSAVRHALEVPFRGASYPYPWVIVDARMAGGPFAFDEASLMIHGHALLVVISLDRDVTRLVGNGADPLELLPKSCHVHEEVWRSSFRISYRQVDSYRHGRVFLAGDAAHIHSPVGARGMNLGIEDATILARKMVDGDLGSYSDERHAVGARVIRQTHILTRIVAAHRPSIQWLRDHLALPLLRVGRAQQALGRRIAGLA